MWGIRSEALASIASWAVRGLTEKPSRMTTVPRSNGPTVAALTIASDSGAPL